MSAVVEKRDEVLALLAEGVPGREIARRTGVPESTVRGIKKGMSMTDINADAVATATVDEELEAHPVASIFPLMDEATYRTFKADVEENGLREPIWLWKGDGRILDGRNRYRACRELGITPEFQYFDGDESELASFVVSLNLHRRHLTESQRSMVAAKLKPMFEAEAKKRQATSTGGSDPQLTANLPEAEKGESREKAAELLNVSARSVDTASTVQRNGVPELVEAVESGEVRVSTAAKVAKLPKEEQKRVVKRGPAAVKEKARRLREAEGGRKRSGTRQDESEDEDESVQVEGDPEPSVKERFLESLPLRSMLNDRCRAIFEEDAWDHECDRELVEKWKRGKINAGAGIGKTQGWYQYKRSQFLRLPYPAAWLKCLADKCDGGYLPTGNPCPSCYGRGYVG